mmetsp:Transcript_32247/g.49355  ORF Transcript_32247/g.49355 Transcript_32247/m.49355 type:complete len:93 (-) Transcript_32247:795-1073(-)
MRNRAIEMAKAPGADPDLPDGLSDVEDDNPIVEGIRLSEQNSESNLDVKINKIKDNDSVRSYSTAGGHDRGDSSSFGVFNQPPVADQASQML